VAGSVEIDVGCGRGTFIARIAREKPAVSFIGIDINESNANQSQDRLSKEGLGNAIIVHDEVQKFLIRHVQHESLNAVHIYFPTPYMEAIRKANILGTGLNQRLIDQGFVNLLHTKCQPGGILRVVTGHRHYFQEIAVALTNSLFKETPWVNPIRSSSFSNLVGTGLEKKQRALGKDIYFLQAVA